LDNSSTNEMYSSLSKLPSWFTSDCARYDEHSLSTANDRSRMPSKSIRTNGRKGRKVPLLEVVEICLGAMVRSFGAIIPRVTLNEILPLSANRLALSKVVR